jgi:hypothetical protein
MAKVVCSARSIVIVGCASTRSTSVVKIGSHAADRGSCTATPHCRTWASMEFRIARPQATNSFLTGAIAASSRIMRALPSMRTTKGVLLLHAAAVSIRVGMPFFGFSLPTLLKPRRAPACSCSGRVRGKGVTL